LAIDCFQQASDKNKHALIELGITYRTQNQLDMAINYFQQISDKNKHALIELGITYRAQNKLDQAIACFKEVLNHDKHNLHALDELGHTYLLQEDTVTAKEYHEKSLKINSQDTYAWDGLGNVYRRLGQKEKAIECYHKMLEFDIENIGGLIKIGQELEKLDKQAQALAYYEEAMRIDKQNQELLQRINALERERNHHTAELIRVGTLLSANTLTTGLAHEIKNPLAGIQLTVSNLLRELDKGTVDTATLRAKLQKIQSNADRINERIGQARSLAEDTLDPTKPPTTETIAIKQLFEHTLEGFQQQLSINEITVEVQVPDNVPALETNAIALEQVLANLLSNAIDALKGQGGTIRLTAEFVAPHLVVTCHDNGAGIAPQDQRRIFEPLFTTKSRGQGTGIGLWLCKMIIEHWHGTIRFVSAPMQGTTFTITLPLKQEE